MKPYAPSISEEADPVVFLEILQRTLLHMMGLGCESTCLSAFLTRRQHGKSHWRKIQAYINGHRDLYCNPGSCWSNSPVFSNLWIQSVQERSASSVAPLFPFFEITVVPQCPILKKERRLVDSINIFWFDFISAFHTHWIQSHGTFCVYDEASCSLHTSFSSFVFGISTNPGASTIG